MEDHHCAACGCEHANVMAGQFRLCGACSSTECLRLAIKVATAKHKAKLEKMLREAE